MKESVERQDRRPVLLHGSRGEPEGAAAYAKKDISVPHLTGEISNRNRNIQLYFF